MDTGKLFAQTKQVYAQGAKLTGDALTKVGVLGDTPPSRDDRLKHWAFSLTRVHDSLAIAELDVPWWTYRAIDVVDAWLSARPHPIRVYEYGSGASTLWLAKRADEVYTVEHHRGFAEHVAPNLEAAGAKLQIVEPTEPAVITTPSAKEGHEGLDFTDYVASIDNVDGEFDVVVIDGRARESCLKAAMGRLKADGIIVYDNSRRARYHAAIVASGMQERALRGLTPTLPYPDQTSILTFAR